MSIEVTIPEIGESISEVQIGEWLKAEGDYVARNEELVVIETDKATVEIPAPESGRLTKIIKKTGESASVNEIIGYMDASADSSRELRERKPAKATNGRPDRENVKQAKDKQGLKEETPDTKGISKKPADAEASERRARDNAEGEKSKATAPIETTERKPPIEERSEKREELGAGETTPTEPGTPEWTETEVLRKPLRLHRSVPPEERTVGEAPVDREKREAAPAQASRGAPAEEPREEESVPMTQLRRRIAERLVHAQQ